MNKIKNYPFMAAFLNGSVMINSGGFVATDDEIIGTSEEWTKAENWLRNTFDENLKIVYHIGMLADEGLTMVEQNPEYGDPKYLATQNYGNYQMARLRENGTIIPLEETGNEYRIALAFEILERFY